jgi:hypothetical protein
VPPTGQAAERADVAEFLEQQPETPPRSTPTDRPITAQVAASVRAEMRSDKLCWPTSAKKVVRVCHSAYDRGGTPSLRTVTPSTGRVGYGLPVQEAPRQTDDGLGNSPQDAAAEPEPRRVALCRTIDSEVDARELAVWLAGDSRDRAAIVITTRPSQTRPFLEPAEIAEALQLGPDEADPAAEDDGPELFFLACDRALHAFNHSMPEKYGIEWSNARLYWPNFKLMGRSEGHPIIRENKPDPIGWLRARYTGGPRVDLEMPGRRVRRKPGELSHIDRMTALMGALAQSRAEVERQRERAGRAERTGRRSRRSRQAERDGGSAAADQVTDVDREFREEIFGIWLDIHRPEERVEFPLRNYRLGSSFLESVAGLPSDVARRVPRACAVVLCGRVAQVGDYQPYHLGLNPQGGSGQRVRASDVAAAMGCRVAGSHELRWWARKGGDIDLTIVVPRDSPLMPED